MTTTPGPSRDGRHPDRDGAVPPGPDEPGGWRRGRPSWPTTASTSTWPIPRPRACGRTHIETSSIVPGSVSNPPAIPAGAVSSSGR
jgi:hypothetical protein